MDAVPERFKEAVAGRRVRTDEARVTEDDTEVSDARDEGREGVAVDCRGRRTLDGGAILLTETGPSDLVDLGSSDIDSRS